MERVLLEGTSFKGRPVVPNPVVSYLVFNPVKTCCGHETLFVTGLM